MNTKVKEKESELVLDNEIPEQSSAGKELTLERHDSDKLPEISIAKDASALMQTIQKISLIPDFDMDRFERLYAMHNEMLAKQAEMAFNEAMAKAQGEIQSVVVNKFNKHTKSGYSDLSGLHENAKPIWTKHGFSVMSKTKPSEIQGHIYVTTKVSHAGGHSEVIEDDWPLDMAGAQGTTNKTPIQAKGSTLSYARRYSEMAIFDVAVKGEDNDGNASASQELSSTAADWLALLEEATNLESLQEDFKKGYQDLKGDGYGRNLLIKTKDAKKKELEGNQ